MLPILVEGERCFAFNARICNALYRQRSIIHGSAASPQRLSLAMCGALDVSCLARPSPVVPVRLHESSTTDQSESDQQLLPLQGLLPILIMASRVSCLARTSERILASLRQAVLCIRDPSGASLRQ